VEYSILKLCCFSRINWKTVLFTFSLLLLLPILTSAQDTKIEKPVVKTEKTTFDVKWGNGFSFASSDKQHNLKFGGRIMYDAAFFGHDSELDDHFGDLKSGLEFRRARFFSSGFIYNRIKYKIQFDFSGGDVVFKDVYIQLTKLPGVGNLRVGHFKEPFRIEALTSSKYITFMERSQHVPFSPERNTGLLFYNDLIKHRVGWQIGFFRNGDKQGNDKLANNGSNITARLTGLILKDDANKRLVHLGIGYSHRSPKSDEYKVSTRPESHLAPKLLSTGTITEVNNVNLANFELAFVTGPLSLQGEYLISKVSVKENPDYSFSAFYGQVSYFLTGESRKYKNSYEGFNRIKPAKNFGDGNGGIGAWEVAVRYSTIDLIDGNIDGGQLNDITLGLNWYLNPATRVMTNFVLADVKDVGKARIFQTRFQIDF
jgi:phosphate-selective porin OprO/OprP